MLEVFWIHDADSHCIFAKTDSCGIILADERPMGGHVVFAESLNRAQ